MTELAYLPTVADAYIRSFRARVVALPPGAAVLDRTYFYPTGGGQPADRGTFDVPGGGQLEVVDVAKSGPSVVHRLKGPAAVHARLAVGLEVGGAIDWERRHRHMRLHTAQHFLSARLFERYGCRTRKAKFSGVLATLELDDTVPAEAVGPLGEDFLDVARSPRPVSIQHVPRAEWDRHPASRRSGLVPLPAQVDPVRVVEIAGVDICPCGGTHLRSTGEIGPVALGPPTPLPVLGSRVTFTLRPEPPNAPTA